MTLLRADRLAHRHAMVIALVLVWALVLGLSPGLALMVGALALMLLDGTLTRLRND